MKVSPLNKAKNKAVRMDTFDHEIIVRAFNKLGFLQDYETRLVMVLRNSNFPFQRIVIPSVRTIHIELLKLYAEDIGISVVELVNLISRTSKPYP